MLSQKAPTDIVNATAAKYMEMFAPHTSTQAPTQAVKMHQISLEQQQQPVWESKGLPRPGSSSNVPAFKVYPCCMVHTPIAACKVSGGLVPQQQHP